MRVGVAEVVRKKFISVGVVVALFTSLSVLAIASEGFPITEVDLNDSGIWVTNQGLAHLGRFNYSAQQLDGVSYVTEMTRFDVLQHNASVLLVDAEMGILSSVNPAKLTIGRTITLGAGTQVALGADMVGIFMKAHSAFWLLPFSSVEGFDPASEIFPPLIEDLSDNTVIAMGHDGAAYVVDPQAGVLKQIFTDTSETPYIKTTSMSGLTNDSNYSMTVVGRTPVLLNQATSKLYLGSSRVVDVMVSQAANSVSAVALQLASGAASAVLYQTGSALVSQPLNGGHPVTVEVSAPTGKPTPPVQLGGCNYAVWSGTGEFIRDCVGQDNNASTFVPDAKLSDELRFRVNRGNIVLNEVPSGSVWLVADRIVKVDDWETAINTDQGDSDEESQTEVDENKPPDRTIDNHPPKAEDDFFGARPGMSVLLPVVENDTDEDGDLLTVSLIGEAPRGTTLNLVYAESVFQMDVPDDAAGVLEFTYEVSDGRGGTSQANVTVEIHQQDVNAPPVQVRPTTLTVSSGRKLTYNVLTNWRDPDGDTIYLVGATCSKEDSVQITQDGSLTFQDGGVTTGKKTILLEVSDGRDSAFGEIVVNVYPPGNRAPDPTPDLVSGIVDMPITIRPLENDLSPDGSRLRLTSVSDHERCFLDKDMAQGVIVATCDAVGSYYLDYTVSTGPSANQPSWIRIVVLPPPDEDAPPVAVPDTVLLSTGQEAYVNVLDNDVNPMGYPLVVTSVQAVPDLPFTVTIINHARLMITPNRDFSAPLTFTYTVSNGKGYATSTVTVVPIPAPERIMSPTAVDDTVMVRVGDIATVDVLANDTQPNGIPLKLLPDLVQSPNPETEALVFTSGNLVRIHARMTPGTYTALYQTAAIKGSAEPATGRLTIYVIADDVANQPPKPKQVEIRTLIGRPVVISIPLDGIDPNGDFVSLVGLGSAPEKGQITEVTSTGFVYSPGDTTDGNDEFTYVVADRRGLEAVGRVVIGIASANDSNAPPIALTDIIETRPGREVAIPVTANDSDPNGKPCCVLVADSVTSDDFTAFTRDNDVVVTVPTTPGSYWGTYEVANASGLTSTGMIVVVVNPDLKLRPPILGDDVVTAAEVLTLDSVTLSVRDNDRDPDGDVMTTTVSVADPTLIVDGGMVTVPITAELQILDYWLTNQDGLVGHGFITVPGRETTPPQIDPSTIGIEVKQGDSVTFLLSDHIIVRPGRTPRVTEAAKISAWHGAAEAVSITELSFQAPQDYAGPAAVTLEVTDGETLEDSTGLRNIVSIPVTIIPRVGDEKNYLVHIEDAAIEVEVGQSTSLNLAGLVTGVQQLAILVFSITDETRPAGMDISLSGSTLSASSNVNVPKGTVARVSVKVTAGSYSDEGQVTVTVVGSKKPLAVAVNDFVPDANQGQQTCVNVVANDTNPFPGQPLTVVEALVESGRGMAVIGCGNGGVAVTPAPDFLGEMVVRYTIQDATEDPDRQVQGRIFLTVRGKPDPPTGLHIDKVDNKLVILSWLPPNNNGTPITGYTVTSDNGYVKQCPATTCSLDGLQNDVPYKFRVTATNEVGTSDPSEWSDEARPDIVPFPLEAPDIKFGDKSLVLTWIPKGSDGSPVTSYDLMIEPAPGSGPSIINTTKTSYTWTGLVNGTEYRVRVCAKNKAPGVCEEDSHWSPLSRGEIPAGVPDAPVAPTWTRLNPVGAERQVRVCWNTPYQNGDAISTYTLRSSTGVIYEAAATGNSTCVTTTLPTSTTAYTFTVAGTNKAGQGAFSPPSSGFRAVNPPGAVSGALVVDKDEACQISFNPAALNGASASEVTYHWRASCGCAGDFGTHTSGTTDTWMSNAETVTIYVWASTTVQGNTENGPEIVAGTCSPYGLPLAPGLSATTGVNTAQYTWSPPSANGRPVSSMQVSINNGTWTTLGSLSGTATLGSGCGLSYDVKVRAVDSLGQIGAVTQRTATTQSCVQPSITMGLTGTKCQYTVGTECYVMWVETHDFVGNATCQIVSTSVGLNERWKPWTQGPNERKQPGPGVGHRVVVKIDCTDGGTGQFVTSGNYQMP